jgi:hypothetical protein
MQMRRIAIKVFYLRLTLILGKGDVGQFLLVAIREKFWLEVQLMVRHGPKVIYFYYEIDYNVTTIQI